MEKESKIKSVCVFGKGQLAIEICKIFRSFPSAYSLDLVVPVLPEPEWAESFLSWSYNEGLEVRTLNPGELFTGPRFDIGFSCFYNKIFKESEISFFNLLLNLHNSPLPKYRGKNPINWALKNNETNHGVTIHKIEPGIDTGPIYGQIIFPINENNEVVDVLNLALDFGKNLAESVIRNLNKIIPYKQDDSQASYYSAKDFYKLEERSYFTRGNS
jgi:methionyl-tRNA formyltransferase